MSTALDRSASTRSSQNSMSPWSRVIRPILASRPQPPNSHAEMSTALSTFVTVLMTRSCAPVRSFIATFSPAPCCSTRSPTYDSNRPARSWAKPGASGGEGDHHQDWVLVGHLARGPAIGKGNRAPTDGAGGAGTGATQMMAALVGTFAASVARSTPHEGGRVCVPAAGGLLQPCHDLLG